MIDPKKLLLAAISSFCLAPLLLPATGNADVLLAVPNKAQEHSNWCWDGSSQAVLKYYGEDVPQCDIANWVFQRTDCCGNPNFYWGHPCNQGNYLSEAERARSMQGIMTQYGGVSSTSQGALSQGAFVSEIDAGRPFVMRFDWKTGGAHALVGYGYDLSGQYLDYMDPWPGYGYMRSTYTSVVDAADHTWTQTLKITSNPKPTATTAAASTISAYGGTLNGSVNANNSSTTVTFEYGTSTSYGSTVTAEQSPISGVTAVAVSKMITDLVPNTLYHFRVKATNSEGATFGSDMYFTTASVYTLTVLSFGTGTGTVTSTSPASPVISCGSTCSGSYLQGTTVALTATPDPGKIFTGWSGACSGKGPCTVTMNSPQSVAANFVPDITPILMMLLSD